MVWGFFPPCENQKCVCWEKRKKPSTVQVTICFHSYGLIKSSAITRLQMQDKRWQCRDVTLDDSRQRKAGQGGCKQVLLGPPPWGGSAHRPACCLTRWASASQKRGEGIAATSVRPRGSNPWARGKILFSRRLRAVPFSKAALALSPACMVGVRQG